MKLRLGWLFPVFAAAIFFIAGCKGPNSANITLRKQNQELQSKVTELERQHGADQAQIKAYEQKAGTPPMVEQQQLDKLFTVHGLQLGRLTGVSDSGDGLKVYAVPTDDAGQVIKAAGAFAVDAFDLTKGDNARIGHWDFPADQAKQNWFGQAMLYTYVLNCPTKELAGHGEITIRVTFTDSLTGRSFTAQKAIKPS